VIASAPVTTSRRSAMKAFVIGGLLAGFGGTIALVRSRGYDASRAMRSLSPLELAVVEHAARRIAAPDRSDDVSIPSPDALDVSGFVDSYVARMAPPMRRDLGRALTYLEHVAPLTVGKLSRFTALAPDEQDHVLEALERSPVALLRGAFAGIKSLVFMGYYRDPRTWGIVGYGGPLVNNPVSIGRPKP
jgi:hypothetical protein